MSDEQDNAGKGSGATKERALKRRNAMTAAGLVGFPLLLFAGLWAWAFRDYLSYSPRQGDLVFQSLPHCPVADAIEGATCSPYSHCGIVVRSGSRWMVLEAIGPVKETPLYAWVSRGRDAGFAIYRTNLAEEDMQTFVAEARKHLGKPYDGRYRLDDEHIYCSELIYKAYLQATGNEIAPLTRFGDLNWKSFEDTVRKQEGGNPPLDRMMITPVGITMSDHVTLVRGTMEEESP